MPQTHHRERTLDPICLPARGLLIVAIAGSFFASACAHRAGKLVEPVSAGDARTSEYRGEPIQTLYRLHYDGPEGAETVRLTLRVDGEDRFQVAVSDPVAGNIWALETMAGRVTFVNHREKVYCSAEGMREMQLAKPGMNGVPLSALPAILLGLMPVATEDPPVEGSFEVRENTNRLWKGKVVDGKVSSWSLADQEGLLLWWIRHDAGGVLSHREGQQIRWQERAREQLSGNLPVLDVPSRYRLVSCDEEDTP